MKAVSQQHPCEVTAVKRNAALFDAWLFHAHPLAQRAFVDLQQGPHFHALRAGVKVKDNRFWTICYAVATSLLALWLHRVELSTRLFAIPDGVIGAERNLLATGQQEFLAALHQVLLVESPGIHEVLQHDHDHVLRDIPDGKVLGKRSQESRVAK